MSMCARESRGMGRLRGGVSRPRWLPFDPEIEVNKDGVVCVIWGWDGGGDAEMLYSLNRGEGWEAPKKIADINWGKPGLASIQTDSQGHFHVVWNQGVRGKTPCTIPV